jgi:hypothetical protein
MKTLKDGTEQTTPAPNAHVAQIFAEMLAGVNHPEFFNHTPETEVSSFHL